MPRKQANRTARTRGLTANKAKKILKDGTVRGKAITTRQKKFFGAVAGGQKPKKGKK